MKIDLHTGDEGYVYLASPYSHKDPDVMDYRHNASCVVAAGLISRGVILFAPIAQSVAIVKHGYDLDSSWKTWKRFDTLFVLKSKCIYVLTLEGWQESVGVKEEIECASDVNIPVYYLDPKTLTLTTTYCGD